METSQSPRMVMRAAWHLAQRKLRPYFSKFSRHDFTVPQLFACLVLRELLGLSYRKVEKLLVDSEDWLAEIGICRAPDHNTLCRAAARLLKSGPVKRLLDEQVGWATNARMLRLSTRPLAMDSSMYESRHVSRHYEHRRAGSRRQSRLPSPLNPAENARLHRCRSWRWRWIAAAIWFSPCGRGRDSAATARTSSRCCFMPGDACRIEVSKSWPTAGMMRSTITNWRGRTWGCDRSSLPRSAEHRPIAIASAQNGGGGCHACCPRGNHAVAAAILSTGKAKRSTA